MKISLYIILLIKFIQHQISKNLVLHEDQT